MIDIDPRYSPRPVLCMVALFISLILFVTAIGNQLWWLLLVAIGFSLNTLITVLRYKRTVVVHKSEVYAMSILITVPSEKDKITTKIKRISKRQEKIFYWSSILLDVFIFILTVRHHRAINFICHRYTILLKSGEEITLDNYWFKEEYVNEVIDYLKNKNTLQS